MNNNYDINNSLKVSYIHKFYLLSLEKLQVRCHVNIYSKKQESKNPKNFSFLLWTNKGIFSLTHFVLTVYAKITTQWEDL